MVNKSIRTKTIIIVNFMEVSTPFEPIVLNNYCEDLYKVNKTFSSSLLPSSRWTLQVAVIRNLRKATNKPILGYSSEGF